MTAAPYHTPVLLKACLEYLNVKASGTYVDLTFGGGGHSRAILNQLGKSGRPFAFDQDADAKRNVIDDPRFTLIPHNFRYVKNYLRLYEVSEVDGILGDLGVSSHQFDEADRGFSIRFDGPLDMRMNRESTITAASVLNTYDEQQLRKVFREYGELTEAGKVAKRIVAYRSEHPLNTTAELKACVEKLTPRRDANKFLAKLFQALRIEVNREMDALKECLGQCPALLKPGGRLVVISYHSLEDRMVKQLMRSGNVEGKVTRDEVYGTTTQVFNVLTTKSVTADENEIEMNSRARSARLRAAEKIRET